MKTKVNGIEIELTQEQLEMVNKKEDIKFEIKSIF
jgi:hypothetical protein